MWGSIIGGLGIPILGQTVMLIYTGVSYRFGSMCHINIDHSQQDYWIPLLALSAAALVLQLTTMAYCIYVYVKSLFDHTSTTNSSTLPSYSASIRTLTARQAYRRIRRVLKLQWRGVAVVLVIVGNVIFFAVVFVHLNDAVKPTEKTMAKAEPWIACLTLTKGDRNRCEQFGNEIGPNAATLLAVLILLSLVGFWTFILFFRPSFVHGWIDLFKSKCIHRHEYIFADARGKYNDVRAYEMLSNSMKTPEPVLKSPTPSRMDRVGSSDGGYFGREANYVAPSLSFSAPKRPRPPSSSQGREWVPEATFARGYNS